MGREEITSLTRSLFFDSLPGFGYVITCVGEGQVRSQRSLGRSGFSQRGVTSTIRSNGTSYCAGSPGDGST